MSRVRRDLTLLLPGGFVVLAALLLLRPGVTPDAVRPYIDVSAVVVLVLACSSAGTTAEVASSLAS